jgi:hypothetical protein
MTAMRPGDAGQESMGEQNATQVEIYVVRALPGPDFRLTGSLARARTRDRERIAALKRAWRSADGR